MIKAFILNWNGGDLLTSMLPGLTANLDKTGQNYSVHIRDNGSKDNSIQVISRYPQIDLMSVDHNRASYSEGMNSLISSAYPNDNDILLMANNDLLFKDDVSLLNMWKLMNKTNSAICGAKLLYADSTISHNGVIFSHQYGDMPWHFQMGEQSKDNKSRYFQATTAACAFVRADAFNKANGFDPGLRWAFEDVSLNLEVSITQKQKVVCCGETNIVHLTSASLKKNPVNKMFLSSNVKHFKNKWAGKYQIDHQLYLSNKNYNVVEL